MQRCDVREIVVAPRNITPRILEKNCDQIKRTAFERPVVNSKNGELGWAFVGCMILQRGHKTESSIDKNGWFRVSSSLHRHCKERQPPHTPNTRSHCHPTPTMKSSNEVHVCSNHQKATVATPRRPQAQTSPKPPVLLQGATSAETKN
eukprot:Gb_15871 [translate_table: standard]